MPISDFFRLPVAEKSPYSAGYTLLEIIVVVALIGLLTGIAAPRMTAVYAGIRWASERDEVLRQMAGLTLCAFKEARELTMFRYPDPEGEGLPLDIPAGWSIAAQEKIRYSPDGICSGGRVRLSKDDRTFDVELVPPLCIPRIP